MPLVVNTLTSSIQSVFDKKLENINQIAAEIANAYQLYAAQALGAIGDPVILTGVESVKLKNALASLMSGRMPAPSAANVISTAVMAFWLAPPVHTGGGGTCVSIIPQAAVSKMVATNVNASSQAAASLAQAFHLMTKTVFVVYPSPLPPGFLV
jgi:hypothetical protein